jgi:uncharacterized protein YebE (UPF0316 family)
MIYLKTSIIFIIHLWILKLLYMFGMKYLAVDITFIEFIVYATMFSLIKQKIES